MREVVENWWVEAVDNTFAAVGLPELNVEMSNLWYWWVMAGRVNFHRRNLLLEARK